MLTLQEAKAQLNIPTADTGNDDEIQDYIDAVTSVVEYQTGEVVDLRQVTEYHQVPFRSSLMLFSSPVVSVVSVTSLDGTVSWDTSDILVSPKLGKLIVDSGSPFDGYLEVVVEAGYDPVPANYNLAARIILQHLWKTQRGVASAPFAGGAATALGEGGTGFAVPRRAQELLGGFMPSVA